MRIFDGVNRWTGIGSKRLQDRLKELSTSNEASTASDFFSRLNTKQIEILLQLLMVDVSEDMDAFRIVAHLGMRKGVDLGVYISVQELETPKDPAVPESKDRWGPAYGRHFYTFDDLANEKREIFTEAGRDMFAAGLPQKILDRSEIDIAKHIAFNERFFISTKKAKSAPILPRRPASRSTNGAHA